MSSSSSAITPLMRARLAARSWSRRFAAWTCPTRSSSTPPPATPLKTRLAGRGVAQGGRERVDGNVAHHIAAGARAQHGAHRIAVALGRVGQHARVRRGGKDRAHGVVAPARHTGVDQRKVGALGGGQLGSGKRTRGDADELESARRGQRGRRPGRLQLLIVRDQDADRHPCHGWNIPPGEVHVNMQPREMARWDVSARDCAA